MVLGRASVQLVAVGERAGRLTSLELSPGRLRAAIARASRNRITGRVDARSDGSEDPTTPTTHLREGEEQERVEGRRAA